MPASTSSGCPGGEQKTQQISRQIQEALGRRGGRSGRGPAGGVRRPPGRARPADPGALRRARGHGGHPDLHRHALRLQGRRDLHRGPGPRRHRCLGALSITNREMSLPVLAALLTIIGYSVNDTIVVYDRMRENRGRGPRRGPELRRPQMNGAINQTLSRTILTAFTVFFSAVILFLFGGKVLHDFAFALVVGVVTGTYSLGRGRDAGHGLGALATGNAASAEARARREGRGGGGKKVVARPRFQWQNEWSTRRRACG